MNTLRMRLGAIALALLSVAVVVFGALNYQQRSAFSTPDDGVSWLDTSAGVTAWLVAPGSPASGAGIRPGDVLRGLNGAPIQRSTQVTKRLWRLGAWAEAHYKLVRGGQEFETSLITVPAYKPSSIEDYLRVVGLLYLFIGLFIFLRRWTAARAVHFYLFCLTSFVFYTFHYSGKLNSFAQSVSTRLTLRCSSMPWFCNST